MAIFLYFNLYDEYSMHIICQGEMLLIKKNKEDDKKLYSQHVKNINIKSKKIYIFERNRRFFFSNSMEINIDK